MKKFAFICFAAIISLVACKKEEQTISLKGKWNVESIVTKEYYNNALSNTNTEPGGGYKYDFRDNGDLVITGGIFSASHPYTILSDTKVNIDGDVFEIRNLTKSNVTLFIHIDYSPGEYDDLFINLNR